MPLNQPPIAEDAVEAAWDLELTQLINELEQTIILLQASFEDVNERVTALENA